MFQVDRYLVDDTVEDCLLSEGYLFDGKDCLVLCL